MCVCEEEIPYVHVSITVISIYLSIYLSMLPVFNDGHIYLSI